MPRSLQKPPKNILPCFFQPLFPLGILWFVTVSLQTLSSHGLLFSIRSVVRTLGFKGTPGTQDNHFFFKTFVYLYFLLAALGLCCCPQASSGCLEQGLPRLPIVVVLGLL